MTSREDVLSQMYHSNNGADSAALLDAYVAEKQAEAWDEGAERMERYHGRHPIDDHAPRPRNPYAEEATDDDA